MKVATRRKEQDAPAGGAPAAEAAEAEAAEGEAADAPQQQENEAEGGAELQVEKRKLIRFEIDIRTGKHTKRTKISYDQAETLFWQWMNRQKRRTPTRHAIRPSSLPVKLASSGAHRCSLRHHPEADEASWPA